MTFTMGAAMAGPHEFWLHVRSNDPQQPEKLLVLKSDWIPPAGSSGS
ncbi:MAG: hypothetical protein ACYC5O_15565 [Anaerolineae bacterium]